MVRDHEQDRESAQGINECQPVTLIFDFAALFHFHAPADGLGLREF
ncbi:MAG TPA: hypothetical protein VEU33_18170 [Archangium sp.]|nr:hypothetical protein [Archangium sp.]